MELHLPHRACERKSISLLQGIWCNGLYAGSFGIYSEVTLRRPITINQRHSRRTSRPLRRSRCRHHDIENRLRKTVIPIGGSLVAIPLLL
jgi:hypothetical protein